MPQPVSPSRTGKPTISIAKLHDPELLSALIQKVCHDIGNPLTSIISLASLLEGGATPPKPERLALYSRSIIDESWRVARLSERLSMLFARSKGVGEPVPVMEILNRAVHRYQTRHAKKELPFHFDTATPSPSLYGDPEQLVLLFMELLENAALAEESLSTQTFKLTHTLHSPSRAEAKEPPNESEQLQAEPAYAEIVVTNLSTTSAAEDLSQLFEPLTQGAGRKKSLGLGLTIAAIATERLGGEIWIEERPLDSAHSSEPTPSSETEENSTPRYHFSVHLRLPARAGEAVCED